MLHFPIRPNANSHAPGWIFFLRSNTRRIVRARSHCFRRRCGRFLSAVGVSATRPRTAETWVHLHATCAVALAVEW